MGIVVAILNVIDRQGLSRELEAVEGWRVMEILRDDKVGIEGVCGGSCDCGTCHVIVAQEWAESLPEPRDEEIDALDGLTLTLAEAA
ncbi:2Fe-2S ferredoxin [Hyphomicrobiales bacterium]|nr:2Fe-2S ferredoxin [Hyphomicrobiales bacterium]CAH1701266.1 2Fe-2S ferredoxin [Hyphomicrobiales bacterium]CAI0345229.1 2Fe-2S ferredoxin [Hyphomicrobiales bacterium]